MYSKMQFYINMCVYTYIYIHYLTKLYKIKTRKILNFLCNNLSVHICTYTDILNSWWLNT